MLPDASVAPPVLMLEIRVCVVCTCCTNLPESLGFQVAGVTVASCPGILAVVAADAANPSNLQTSDLSQYGAQPSP